MHAIQSAIDRQLPEGGLLRAAMRQELFRVCSEFVRRGLADPKFEVELGLEGKFWSCVSEALLADQLRDKNFPNRPNRGAGPDFLVMAGDLRVWIEVVCPEPKQVPDEWRTFKAETVVDFPHREILLRWTSAVQAKAKALIGSADGGIEGYLQKRVVAPNDAYVIAVNGCQLRNGGFPALCGISGLPFAAEAVFAIGPHQLTIDRGTQAIVERGHQHRPCVLNSNGAEVSANSFLDLRFSSISAIWAVDLNGGRPARGCGLMSVIHNPNATNPIPFQFLPADEELVATWKESDGLTIEIIRGAGESSE